MLAVWNKQQFKCTCRNCGECGHKLVLCPEKKIDEEINGNYKCHLTGKCSYFGTMCNRINECHKKKATEEKAKVAIDDEKEHEDEKANLAFDSTS